VIEEVKPLHTKTLYEALLRAQTSLSSVLKDARNSFSNYNYVSSESMILEARAALLKEGLVLRRSSWHFDQGGTIPTVSMRFVLAHPESGQMTEDEAQFPVIEKKGTPSDKALAAALTSGLSYYLRDLLLLARSDEEMDKRNDNGDGDEPVYKGTNEQNEFIRKMIAELGIEAKDKMKILQEIKGIPMKEVKFVIGKYRPRN
jgi:hypothetical protein